MRRRPPQSSSPEPPRKPTHVAPPYGVKIHTADGKGVGKVLMSMHGSKGSVAKFPLRDHAKPADKELFRKESVDDFEIPHNDIGQVTMRLMMVVELHTRLE